MFCRIHLWSHLVPDFCLLGVLITDSTSLLITGLFVCSISSWFSLGRLYLSKNSFISSRLSLLLEHICLEDSGTSWGEPRCLSLPGGPVLSPHPGGELPHVFCSPFGCCRHPIQFEAWLRTSDGFCSPANFREPRRRLETDPTLQQRLLLHQNLLPMRPAQSPLLSEYRNGQGAEALLQIRGDTCILQPSDI